MRLQHKLKETQVQKERLEKRLEQYEGQQDLKFNQDQAKNMDAIKINELEIENGRLRGDLKKLRESVANNNNTHDQV